MNGFALLAKLVSLGGIVLIAILLAGFGHDSGYVIHASMIATIAFGFFIYCVRSFSFVDAGTSNTSEDSYLDSVIKAGAIATVFWGFAGFLLGIVIALLLAWPALNLGKDLLKCLHRFWRDDSLVMRGDVAMSDLLWLSTALMRRIKPYFSLSHGVSRVDDKRIVNGIIFVIRNGLRWRDAPKDYGLHKTIYNRFIRWSRLGVFNRILAELAGMAGTPDQVMIDATHLKAHRTAASLLKKGMFPDVLGVT